MFDTRVYSAPLSECLGHRAPLQLGMVCFFGKKLYNVNPECLVRRADIHSIYHVSIMYVYIYILWYSLFWSIAYTIVGPVLISRSYTIHIPV